MNFFHSSLSEVVCLGMHLNSIICCSYDMVVASMGLTTTFNSIRFLRAFSSVPVGSDSPAKSPPSTPRFGLFRRISSSTTTTSEEQAHGVGPVAGPGPDVLAPQPAGGSSGNKATFLNAARSLFRKDKDGGGRVDKVVLDPSIREGGSAGERRAPGKSWWAGWGGSRRRL